MTAKCILIVDPHPVIADSLSVSLEQHPPFKAESCAAYTEATTCIGRVAPDLVVLSVYQHTVAESLTTCRECAAVSGKHMIVLLAPRELVEQESFTLDAIEASSEPPAPTEKLTPRERDVADLVMAGKTTPEIAEQLSISEHTVQTHISNILAKLNVRTRAEAAVQLYQWRMESQAGRSAAKPLLAD